MNNKKTPQKPYVQQPAVNPDSSCAREPGMEYQVMKNQTVSPCRFTIEELHAEVEEAMAQIERGEVVDADIVMAELQKMVGL